jgi:septal ring factor EnvC (AmiA/AmiB activator)
LLWQGLVNIETEIAKAEKKTTAAQANVDKLKKVIARAETPEEIKATSAEQMKVLEAEMAALQLSIEQFKKMDN